MLTIAPEGSGTLIRDSLTARLAPVARLRPCASIWSRLVISPLSLAASSTAWSVSEARDMAYQSLTPSLPSKLRPGRAGSAVER